MKVVKKRNIGIFIGVFFMSLILDLCTTPLRMINFYVSSIGGFILYFLLMYFCLNRWSEIKPYKLFLIVLLGWIPLNVPIHLIYFEETLISLPDSVMRGLGICFGFLFYKMRSIGKGIVLIITLLFCVGLTPFYKQWIHYLNFDTFSGKVNIVLQKPLEFSDFQDEKVIIGNEDEKIYVLDFWDSHCGICFEQFPEFQKLYDKYQNEDNIRFYAVNIPVRGDSKEQSIKMLTDRGYTLPIVFCEDMKIIKDEIEIKSVPVYIVIKNGEVIYKGGKERLEKIISKEGKL